MNKLRNNYWVNSGIFAVSQRLSVPLFGVVSFLILIRNLSEEKMGVWVLFLTITTVVEVARNGLLKAGIVKLYQERSELKNGLMNASFTINGVYTLLTSTILIVLSGLLSNIFNAPELLVLFKWYFLSSLILCFFSHSEYWFQAEMRFRNVFLLYFIKQGLFLICLASHVFIFKTKVELEVLVFYQIGSLFISVLSVVSFYSNSTIFRNRPPSHLLRSLWSFGRYGFFTNLSNSGLTSTDHLLLGGLLSNPSVAIYNASARITNVFIIPSVAVADIVYPKTVQRNKTDGISKVKELYQKAVGATLVPMFPVFIFLQLFPEFTIELLAGSRYLEAVPILRIAACSIFILPFLKQFGTIVNTLNKPHYNFYFVLLLAICNLAFNYLFILNFGLIGAAMATLSSYTVGLIASQVILHKLARIKFLAVLESTLEFYKGIFKFLWIK